MVKTDLQILCQKIISGGQTGVDRGALDACLEFNLSCGGWCPFGRRAEDGIIPEKYPLQETDSSDYSSRTLKNILDSDATLVISTLPMKGGTKLTAELTKQHNKSLFVFAPENDFRDIIIWLIKNNVKTLNVAGPRESDWKDAYKFSYQLITKLIRTIRKNS